MGSFGLVQEEHNNSKYLFSFIKGKMNITTQGVEQMNKFMNNLQT